MVCEVYSCPACKSGLQIKASEGLVCSNGHFFPFIGNAVPVFDCEDENANEYTISQAADIHENALKWVFATFGGSEASLREGMISRLHLQEGQKVLITGVGAGNDLPYLAQLLGKKGSLYAQDFSRQMLMSAVKRANDEYDLADYDIEFSVSDAINLPFCDNCFDAAYHFGGLNLFSDIGKGIAEMDRVVKSGGRVVFGDEGLAPWLKDTEYGKMIINNNALCDFDAPLIHIPVTARDVNLSWEVGNCFYVIDYSVSHTPLPIDVDVLHIGKRGGTIRTRYFGQLEGIEPTLKEHLYIEAEKRGRSRVDFIEDLLRKGLDNS